MKKLICLIVIAFLSKQIHSQNYLINKVAGIGSTGGNGDGGLALWCYFVGVNSIAIDASNNIYVSDGVRIRKIDASTGIINTIAGTGVIGYTGDGGLALNATFTSITNLVFDTAYNLYFVDGGYRLRKINASTGIVNTIAGNGSFGHTGDGGPALSANITFGNTAGNLAVDKIGNIYLGEANYNDVREIDASTGIINTIVGISGTGSYGGDGGQATACNLNFNNAGSIAIDASGNIYIGDYGNSRIRMVNKTTGIINTIAGTGNAYFGGDGGPATAAFLNGPEYLTLDNSGNIFFLDGGNGRIREINNSTGIINTVMGSGANPISAYGLALNVSGFYLVNESTISAADSTTGIITTIAGLGTAASNGNGGPANAAAINPGAIGADTLSNIYYADGAYIRKIEASTGIINIYAGNGTIIYGGDGGLAINAGINPSSLVLNDSGSIFFTDQNDFRIRKIDAATGIINTIGGTGIQGMRGNGDGGLATDANLTGPNGIALDKTGNIYFLDTYEDSSLFAVHGFVRKIDKVTGIISTVNSFDFQYSSSITMDTSGNIFICGHYNIYKIDALTNNASTYISNAGVYSGDGGPATTAGLYNPTQVQTDIAGNLYISDGLDYRIRKITKSTGIINTIAGNGVNGYITEGVIATNSDLQETGYLTSDIFGNIYFIDGSTIQKLAPFCPSISITVNNIDSVCHGNNAILTASGASSFTWNTGATTNNISANSSVNSYTVTGTSTYGCITTTTVNLSDFCHLVWPGDANEDLIVDNFDLLTLGLKYGKTGHVRDTTGNTWRGYLCNNWHDTLSNGKNTKYADCNGDSIINLNDTLAINLNFSLIHIARNSAPQIVQSINPDIYVSLNKSFYYPGDTVWANVNIGSYTNPQTDFYGAAFTINYDNTNVKPGSEQFYFNNSWVGTINQSQIKFSYLNASAGTVDASLVRVTHTDTNGLGKVATLSFILKDTLSISKLYFTINNSIKTDHNGIYSSLNTGTDSVALLSNLTSINQFKIGNIMINIYPNPNNGSFVIEPQNTLYNVHCTVYDVNGQMVLTQTINGKTSIDASNLNEGVYNISLQSNEGIINKRLVIVR